MQIRCPHCNTPLQLGDPRPGNYKPTCKKCGKAFLLQVGKDDPPSVRTRPSQPRTRKTTGASVGDFAATRLDSDATVHDVADRRTLDPRTVAQSDPSAAGESSRPAKDRDADPGPVPTRLGGYRIVRLIGRGAMGSVYQAKQMSLDRDVALKTIRDRLLKSPASLARFAREAYAAAQLSHHNVVQIYDFGHDAGQHFFSMEWVRGGSLGDLVREKGSLDPKLAATYILQAARGLQFAHRNGMVHRDVKPTNLLIGDDGVVKVADLGLVKVPDQLEPDPASEEPLVSGMQSGTQVTMQGTAVGTPAYMAPEQGDDASSVDHRADIYSLGCTLFYLLSGHAPYQATAISKVLEQHASAPLPESNDFGSRVPEPLRAIVRRAMAKRPSDRYGSLAEMIDDLQSFLGIESLTGFSPSSEQADRWEDVARRYFKTQTLRRLNSPLFWGFAVAAVLTTLLLPWLSFKLILAGPTMFIVGCVGAATLSTLIRNNAVVERSRRWLGTLAWPEIAIASFAGLIVVATVLVTGLWPGVLLGTALGAASATVYHFAITLASQKSGADALGDAKRFVRDLRIAGAEETGLRDFLARYAGDGWQMIYESLFGYDAMIATRKRLTGDATFQGPTDGTAIRDRLCSSLERMTRSNREAIDRKKLARLEQESLIAQGVSPQLAREQSWQMASVIMENARQSTASNSSDVKAAARAKRDRIRAMLADARSGRYKRKRDKYAALKFAFSGFTRLLAGCLLLAVFAFAAQGTGLFDEAVIDEVRRGQFDLESIPGEATSEALGGSTSVWSIGIAGLFLSLSAFVSGWKMTPFAVVATVVILFGAGLGVPAAGPIAPWVVAAVIGIVIYLPGILLGES